MPPARHGATPGGSVYLRVDDVTPIAEELGVEVHDAVSRSEVHLTDPDGNRRSIGALSGRPADGYTHAGQD